MNQKSQAEVIIFRDDSANDQVNFFSGQKYQYFDQTVLKKNDGLLLLQSKFGLGYPLEKIMNIKVGGVNDESH